MKKYYLMKCGHVANAYDPYGNPSLCNICAGLTNLADEIEKECVKNVGLEGRIAKCAECQTTVDSNWGLPFFKFCPEKNLMITYDGCYGWELRRFIAFNGDF